MVFEIVDKKLIQKSHVDINLRWGKINFKKKSSCLEATATRCAVPTRARSKDQSSQLLLIPCVANIPEKEYVLIRIGNFIVIFPKNRKFSPIDFFSKSFFE